MSNKLFLLLLALAISLSITIARKVAYGQSDWRLMNPPPVPSGDTFLGYQFVNDQTIYAMSYQDSQYTLDKTLGEYSGYSFISVFRTNDAGQSWRTLLPPTYNGGGDGSAEISGFSIYDDATFNMYGHEDLYIYPGDYRDVLALEYSKGSFGGGYVPTTTNYVPLYAFCMATPDHVDLVSKNYLGIDYAASLYQFDPVGSSKQIFSGQSLHDTTIIVEWMPNSILSIPTVDLGDELLGDSVDAPVVLVNSGNASIRIDSIRSIGSNVLFYFRDVEYTHRHGRCSHTPACTCHPKGLRYVIASCLFARRSEISRYDSNRIQWNRRGFDSCLGDFVQIAE